MQHFSDILNYYEIIFSDISNYSIIILASNKSKNVEASNKNKNVEAIILKILEFIFISVYDFFVFHFLI